MTMGASFIRLASEAPEKPMVRLATMSRATSSARGLPRACTLMISSRPSASGRSTGTRLLGVRVGVGVRVRVRVRVGVRVRSRRLPRAQADVRELAWFRVRARARARC